ncbi:hypothetical protein [Stappia stellulata]|uniref:hypothetical protein n=1 Tax=Stappia stellulata TaxID=71235 RepID=UPI0012EC0B0D|nr:hypothetical protein [Stappia stellulata]
MNFIVFLLLVLFPFNVFAACSSPSGQASQTRYDFTANKLYYCNDADWVEMGGGGGGGAGVPTDVKLTTSSNNGNFGGFAGMKSFIEANGCAGYQICSADALFKHLENGGVNLSERGWVTPDAVHSRGSCAGWTSSAGGGNYGSYWLGGGYSGVYNVTCSISMKVACCKFD